VANPKKNGRQTTQLGQSAPYYLVQSCRTDWVHTGALTPGRTVQNAAELCEAGPLLMKPYDHKLVLDRIKPLLAARAQQGQR
jgi:hypothetical protein